MFINAFFNAIGKNISANEQARKEAEERDKANRQPGMQYQSAPELDRSSFEQSSPSTVGANLIGDFGKGAGNQLFGEAIKGESAMYNPNMSTQGAFTLGPTDVDSSQSVAPYENSAIARYLRNYGGYRL